MRHPIRSAVVLAAVLTLSGAALARGGGHSGSSGHSRSGSTRSYSYGGGHVSSSYQTVHGYVRSDGHPVASYHRTTGDSTQRNNYSATGNRNPWTGARGTKKPKY